MATGRLLVGFLVAVVSISACTSDAGPTDSEPIPVGQPESVTTEEFDTETGAAADRHLDARGVRATLVDRFDGEPYTAVWVDYRNSGDFIQVRISRSTEDEVRGVITSHVAGRYLEAQIPEGSWSLSSGARTPPFPIDLTGDLEAPEPTPVQIEATRQEMSNGGATWEKTTIFPDGKRHEEWVIHPDGNVVSISFQSDAAILPFPAPGTRTGRFTYELLDNPDPITQPRQGTTLELEKYDIPDDLALLSEVSR